MYHVVWLYMYNKIIMVHVTADYYIYMYKYVYMYMYTCITHVCTIILTRLDYLHMHSIQQIILVPVQVHVHVCVHLHKHSG